MHFSPFLWNLPPFADRRQVLPSPRKIEFFSGSPSTAIRFDMGAGLDDAERYLCTTSA